MKATYWSRNAETLSKIATAVIRRKSLLHYYFIVEHFFTKRKIHVKTILNRCKQRYQSDFQLRLFHISINIWVHVGISLAVWVACRYVGSVGMFFSGVILTANCSSVLNHEATSCNRRIRLERHKHKRFAGNDVTRRYLCVHSVCGYHTYEYRRPIVVSSMRAVTPLIRYGLPIIGYNLLLPTPIQRD